MTARVHSAFADQVLRRVHAVLLDQDVPWSLDFDTRALLTLLIGHVGKDNAVSRERLAAHLNLHDREVRAMVRTLRLDFGVAIGSNRAAGASGYFLVSSAAEAEELTQPLLAQGLSILRLIRALRGRHATAEFFGQARIELGLDTPEDTHAA